MPQVLGVAPLVVAGEVVVRGRRPPASCPGWPPARRSRSVPEAPPSARRRRTGAKSSGCRRSRSCAAVTSSPEHVVQQVQHRGPTCGLRSRSCISALTAPSSAGQVDGRLDLGEVDVAGRPERAPDRLAAAPSGSASQGRAPGQQNGASGPPAGRSGWCAPRRLGPRRASMMPGEGPRPCSHPSQVTTWPSRPPPPRETSRSGPGAGRVVRAVHPLLEREVVKVAVGADRHERDLGHPGLVRRARCAPCRGTSTGVRQVRGTSLSRLQYMQKSSGGTAARGP